SREALDRVEAGTLDLALVQGGLGPSHRSRVRQVATLHVEPLHLLVKEEHLAEVSRSLEALRGKIVNVSEAGSGTYNLAMEVLSFAGLSPRVPGAAQGDFTATTLSYRQLEEQGDRAKLPDAAFMVSALPSPIARHLVLKHRFRLVPLTFGEAFALDVIRSDVPAFQARGSTVEVDKVHVALTEIPPFTYNVDPPVPPRPIETIGTRLLLVANADVEPRAVLRVLDAVFSPGFAQLARPPLDVKLLEIPPEMEWHPGTLQYLERNKALMAGDVVDFLEKGTSLGGAVIGGSFFLWQWWRQRYRRKRDLGFEAYLLKVTAIERQALHLELGAMLDLKELLRLQAELSELKSEALEKFAEGDLEGETLISGFISHVNDTRTYLTRLILHERESLEKQARKQKRSPEALWHEALGEYVEQTSVLDPTAIAGGIEDIGP
ncbi:type 2 periplasmic-binding domain-containing protein, partial [Singulisphaera rosea]